jgi:hypothetical protein
VCCTSSTRCIVRTLCRCMLDSVAQPSHAEASTSEPKNDESRACFSYVMFGTQMLIRYYIQAPSLQKLRIPHCFNICLVINKCVRVIH